MPLVGAGLMLRTFVNLTHAPIGFDPSGIVTAKVALSFRTFADIERRSALHRDAIVRMVAGEGAVLCAVGAGAGLLGAAALTGAIRGLLYDVAPFDVVTLAGAAGLVAAVALIAAGHPAFRAGRVDPAVTLRAE